METNNVNEIELKLNSREITFTLKMAFKQLTIRHTLFFNGLRLFPLAPKLKLYILCQ